MKIIKISTNEQRSLPMNGEAFPECCLYVFRTPVIITAGGTDRIFSGSSAILYTENRRQFFRGTVSKGLRYDMIRFRLSSGDRQYIGGLEIPLDTPIELHNDYNISVAVKNMEMHRHTGSKRKNELSELYMRIILICLEENIHMKSLPKSKVPHYGQLRKIRSEIYENPVKTHTVDELCRRLAVSRTYFHRIYMEAFGVTFKQDIIESRLSYACRLLKETKLSIGLIAEKCGYESDSYFMRQFRKHRGCTPSEYRDSEYPDCISSFQEDI
ncbi:MAG: AraC family transcriptional regulator [Ruminococcus sp.]|nr:AraC family transcriptional regulator [Ruminococcus sp.]